ncbi:MAG: sulfatase [Verrucomicrobiales bacterium]|nr:sulfatase [Verrucomicrobiales bacterium]
MLIHRSKFISLLLLLGCFLLAFSSASQAAQPNILWIIAEDMGPELSCYGTPEVKTPALDQLAASGVRYTHAFTVTGVCSTSRSSFMTGMYAMSIGAQNHRTRPEDQLTLPEGVRVITDWLRPAGYSTANLKQLTTDKQLKKFYKGTGKTDWNFKYQSPVDAKLKPFDTSKWDDLKNSQPFYAQINFSETHRGHAWADAHNEIGIDNWIDPSKVKIPPYYPDHPVTRAVWAQYLNAIMAVDKKVAFIRDLLKRDGLDKNTIIIFLGDHGRAMPRGKQWVYDSGLSIPLIIHWPEGNPELPVPANYQRGSVSDQLIESIDLSATTIALAGVKKPADMQGRVFLGEQQEAPRRYTYGGRDRGDETVLMIRTVRDQRYRYLRNQYPERPFLQLNRYKEHQYPIIALMRDLQAQGKLSGPPSVLMASQRPKEELYDLQEDPYEIHNLAHSPDHSVIKTRLSKELDTWMDRINDQGRTPESKEITDYWEQKLKESYTKKLADRPKNWYLTAPALGPYKIE